MRLFHSALLAVVLAVGSAVVPVTVDDAVAASAEYKAEKEKLKDDKKDLKTIEKLVAKWQKARTKRDQKTMHKVDADLIPWLRDEISEAKAELDEVKDETGYTPPPAGPKVRRAGSAPAGPAPRTGDVRVHRAQDELERLRDIRKALADMQPAFDAENADARQYKEKGELLEELQSMAQAEYQRQDRITAKAKAG